MRQALIKRGRVVAEEVPSPEVSVGSVLIKVVHSCISAGTELAGVQHSGEPLIKKAIRQPAKVMKAVKMVQDSGLGYTIAKVKGQLEAGVPTGYSIAGVVIGVGEGVRSFRVGDRVAAAGAGLANHAEYVDVPENLVMHMPKGLSFETASTVTLGGIALQAVRRADVKLGEYVTVLGAGILGQLAIRMLVASGARVIAIDLDHGRLELAKKAGAELTLHPGEVGNVVKQVQMYTGGHGADVVIFCAATNRSETLREAFGMTRRKGRVVMLGVWGKELYREDIYQKEIDFLISTSYGPGRYDPNYEQKGLDYPYSYVRWTENRNMSEYMRLLACGSLSVDELIEAAYPIDQVEEAFERLKQPDRPMMVLLSYGEWNENDHIEQAAYRVDVPSPNNKKRGPISTAVIGGGAFAQGMLIPILKKQSDSYHLKAICSRTGSNAKAQAVQSGAEYATTDFEQILGDADIDLVLIATRHHLHGKMVLDALKAGKHVFVEKPLCVTKEELDAIKAFYSEDSNSPKPILMVGFNRRFSKHAVHIREKLADRKSPLMLHYRMNAGYLPSDHWTQTEEGGGRIIGEACHVVDLLSSLVGSSVSAVGTASMAPKDGPFTEGDNKVITLEYSDGSLGVIEYFSVGSKAMPKEMLEVHCEGHSIVMNDYRELKGFGVQVDALESSEPRKGHAEEFQALAQMLKGESSAWPISLQEIIETTEICIEIAESQ